MINIKLVIIISVWLVIIVEEITPAVNINPLPRAWTIKYLTLASVSWNNCELAINGIKDNKLSSIPAHKNNQLLLERAIRVPVIVVVINNKDEGAIKLRKESSLSDIKLEAFICASVAYFHSKEPSFHSWYNPNKRIKQNIITVIFINNETDLLEGTGINKAISISKTRNKTAKIKNRSENGIRAELYGSKPHSKGVLFSKLNCADLFNKKVALIIRIGNKEATIILMKIKFIFLGVVPCLWSKNSLLMQASKKGVGEESHVQRHQSCPFVRRNTIL